MSDKFKAFSIGLAVLWLAVLSGCVPGTGNSGVIMWILYQSDKKDRESHELERANSERFCGLKELGGPHEYDCLDMRGPYTVRSEGGFKDRGAVFVPNQIPPSPLP